MSRKSAKQSVQASNRLKGSSSGDSLNSRDGGSSSDDQESVDNRSYTTAIVKEEGYSDDDGSQRNNSRGDSKDQSQSVRAKNREHAKNTRMRKKNYIETLKENIKNISTTRDTRDRERKTALTRLADQVELSHQQSSPQQHFLTSSSQPFHLFAFRADPDAEEEHLGVLQLPGEHRDLGRGVEQRPRERLHLRHARHTLPQLPALPGTSCILCVVCRGHYCLYVHIL